MWEIAIFCALLGETDESTVESQPASVCREVDDLALHFRLRVYDTFRTERPVYDVWAARGFEALEFSRLLPADSPRQRELADWFQRATEATLAQEAVPDLPPIDWDTTAGPATNPPTAATVPVSAGESGPPKPRLRSSLPWGASGAFFSGQDQVAPPIADDVPAAEESSVQADGQDADAGDAPTDAPPSAADPDGA